MTLTWTADVAQAEWLVERMVDFGGVVSSIVPAGFEAYARIFHPIAHGPERRWTDLAHRNGRIAHPEMQYPSFAAVRARSRRTASTRTASRTSRTRPGPCRGTT